jgi:carboxypeptidase Q
MIRARRRFGLAALVACVTGVVLAASGPNDVERDRLVRALLGSTPLESDLEFLSDRIGGRPTGSDANRRAVAWAESRLRDAGVAVRREAFTVPAGWLERSARAEVKGDGVQLTPAIAAMPYSAGTAPSGASGPLVDGGRGSEADFARLGGPAKGAFLLITQDELADVDALFREYNESAAIEQRAHAAQVAGLVYMSSRAPGILYRHNVAVGPANTRPMVVMERSAASKVLRILSSGAPLTITLPLDVAAPRDAPSENVIGEIRGRERPDEIVIFGSHLDAWDLGGGTLDNGANIAMLIDVARQMAALGIAPSRTVRFALWNGEELGMLGSLGYARTHASELDRHVVAESTDIGCGRITGFFTGGRPDVVPVVDRLLQPLGGLGPFTQIDVPLVGTDNFDFMLEGVPNLVANQKPALYGPSYHASNDQMERCDIGDLKLNAAVIGSLIWSYANDATTLPRHTHAEIQALMDRTDLDDQMKTFNLWDSWANGTRGRKP